MLHENKVTVDKAALLAKLHENRTKHESDYLEARKGYRARMLEAARALLTEIVEGRDFEDALSRVASLEAPSSYVKAYIRVIAMLEMSTSPTVTLSTTQFANYVLDEWDWKSAFVSSTAAYK